MGALHNADGEPYVVQCCHKVGELVETKVKEFERNGHTVIEHEHTVRCPEYSCRRDYLVYFTLDKTV